METMEQIVKLGRPAIPTEKLREVLGMVQKGLHPNAIRDKTGVPLRAIYDCRRWWALIEETTLKEKPE